MHTADWQLLLAAAAMLITMAKQKQELSVL